MRPLLYIAGPYTRPDPVINTHAAIRVATAIYEQDVYVPMVPHTTLLWHMVTPRPIDFWYELDLAHMERCDVVVRLPGESSGADREIEHAAKCGIPLLRYERLTADVRRIWDDRLTRSLEK